MKVNCLDPHWRRTPAEDPMVSLGMDAVSEEDGSLNTWVMLESPENGSNADDEQSKLKVTVIVSTSYS